MLPEDIFEVSESSGEDSPVRRWPTHPTDYAKRGNRLYDAQNDSFTFEADVKLNVVRRVSFEDLPQYARAFITARAASQFFSVTRNRPSRAAEESEVRARAAFMAAENRNVAFNMFNGPDMGWTSVGR